MSGLSPLTKEQKKIYAQLQERLAALCNLKDRNIPEVLAALRVILLSKYRDAQRYVLFSLLSGTPLPEGNGPFDFPAPDSIEQFLNDQYTSAYPDYVLFSLLSDAETPQEGDSVPAPIQQFINGQYASTYPEQEPAPLGKPEEAGLSWLDGPLQLEAGPPLESVPKLTVPTGEHEIPFHVKVKEPPPPPPKKTLKDWLKRPFSRRNSAPES
ncbi:MAG: hypothetical protein PHQ12_12660 [Chthoniobacteraceae bacterium]|nr:hypothetical protein [Chthoniobacteraceae bacterium]